MMTETKDRKHISRRKLHGIKAKSHTWAQVDMWTLSDLLGSISKHNDEYPGARIDQVFLCGSLAQMTKEWCEEPLAHGWKFAHPFTFKHRAPVYCRPERSEQEIAVKLISHREGWFPGCEDHVIAWEAWNVLKAEWEKTTGLPLLSSPSKTGQALLWENLPRDKSGAPVEFPSLPADVEKIIRANSPQHRMERFWYNEEPLYQYDGRWMYAALATLDRLPIGHAVKLGPDEEFVRFAPGFYLATIHVPSDWSHIGLVPFLDPDGNGWTYPNEPGQVFVTHAWEPELTLASQNGWGIYLINGWRFYKGRPLDEWAQKLIAMRKYFQDLEAGYNPLSGGESYHLAASAVRQILNHTIGSLHARGYERELFVSDDNWKMWRRENAAWFDTVSGRQAERVEDGFLVTHYVPDNSPLSINMPHWSATIWALERARVAQWALKCDGKEGRPGPDVLVKINGDAIYATAELPFEDTRKLGQLRRKES